MRGTSNSAQDPTGEVYYDAFGNPSLRQGQMPGPQGWAATSGYQSDTDTGLTLMGNRYYDPSIGRFLSEDPAGTGDNWYAYCDNDPLDYTDPSGLQKKGTTDSQTTTYPDGDSVTWTTPPFTSIILANGTIFNGISYASYSWATSTSSDSTGGSTGFFGSLFSSVGSAVDDFATFGLVGRAGAAWGSVDGTNKSRATAIGLTVAAIGAGLAFAATDGEDAEANAEITAAKSLVKANSSALKLLWGGAGKGAAARIANPASASEVLSMGLSREILEAYEKIAVHQIQNGLNSTGIHDLRLQIIRDALSKL